MVVEDDEFNLNVGNLSRTLDDMLAFQEPARGGDRGVLALASPSTPSTFSGSGESNVNIDTQAVQASASSNRKYKLWHVPEDELAFTCARMIGQGHAFCTLKNCSKNHQSDRVCTIIPGEAYVKRSNDSAFSWPSVMLNSLEEDLASSWKISSQSFDDWVTNFNLVTENDESSPSTHKREYGLTLAELEAKAKEQSKFLAFKTPRPKRRKTNVTDADKLPQFKDLQTEADDMTDTATLFSLFKELDSRSKLLLEVLKRNDINFEEERNINAACNKNADIRLSRLKMNVGVRPDGLEPKFDAPNLWLSLASVASELSNMMETFQYENSKVHAKFKLMTMDPPLRSSDFSKRAEPFAIKIKEIESFVQSSVGHIVRRIEDIQVPPSHEVNTNETNSVRDKLIFDKIEQLEREVASLRASNDSESIKFSSLGFRNKQDCDAWVETHHPGSDFGLIMDFHLVMTHVHDAISGVQLMKGLATVHKMKLSHNHQAVAIVSYENRIPKYFVSSSSGYSIVRKDESYFSAIKTWDDWDLPNDGFRDRLDKFLADFEEGFGRDLDAAIEPNSLFHTVATKALSNSVHWVRGLMKFMDDTYNEYFRAHYSGKTAWYITTRLSRSLIEYIGAPRNTIYNTFRIDFPEEISKAMFFASAQSLDRMAEVSSKGFKNSPIVMGELTKFLALNSNYELVGKLHSKIGAIQTSQDSLEKEVAASVKSSSTLASKFEQQLKKPLDLLIKRVDKLEKK